MVVWHRPRQKCLAANGTLIIFRHDRRERGGKREGGMTEIRDHGHRHPDSRGLTHLMGVGTVAVQLH